MREELYSDIFVTSAQLEAKKRKSKVLALVTGSLGNCSSDLLVVIDLIAATKTVRALELRTANRDQLFSIAPPISDFFFRPVHHAPVGPTHP